MTAAAFVEPHRPVLFGILGPVRVEGRTPAVSPLRRAILTALVLRRGQCVGVSELADLLWDRPPPSAGANIRSHVTGLRRDLDRAAPGLSARLRTHRGAGCGYELAVAAGECDVDRFSAAAGRGRGLLLCGEVGPALQVLEEAAAWWRGPFGPGLPATRWFQAHAAGLADARVLAYQDLFAACILAGRTGFLPYRIEAVLAESPYRQRLWELLAAAHCIGGDTVAALAAVNRCRALFAEDLGLDLPPGVAAAQAAALRWDPEAARRLVAAAGP